MVENIERMKIGWVVPQVMPYSIVMASTRLRVYDIIRHLKARGIKTGLYNPFRQYDVVVFQKAFKRRFLSLAEKLKKKGVKIVFDINVNYIDDDSLFVTKQQRRDVRDMLNLTDIVITPSPYLKELYSHYKENTWLIEEIIEDRFFDFQKKHIEKKQVSLLFCGYSAKAKELYLIEDTLKDLYESYGINLVLICEKDPKLNIIPYDFYKYDHKRLPELLLKGDIKISPRDLSRKYNLGHTFTRIGYPMSVGLPVAASPLSSYENSPALLCNDQEQWRQALTKLITDVSLRSELAQRGREFVKGNFSADKIMSKYINLFNELVS